MTRMINELAAGAVEKPLCSNVCGNRNWAIKIDESISAIDGKPFYQVFCGKHRQLLEHRQFSESLSWIREHHTRWYHFTYKKDFEKALAVLKDIDGVTIYRYND